MMDFFMIVGFVVAFFFGFVTTMFNDLPVPQAILTGAALGLLFSTVIFVSMALHVCWQA